MKQFVERLKTDKEFAAEFKTFMSGQNSKIKEGSKQVGEQLNKVVIDSIKEFAASKNITLTDDEQTSHALAALTKQICLQMDDMIVKSFASLEGSMTQPIDIPPEMMKAIKENKDLYQECMHKADKAAEEAIQKCLRELDAAVLQSQKEFAEKVGYQGAYPSAELNKAVAAKLNETIKTQLNGLIQASAAATI